LSDNNSLILEIKKIDKHFPGVHALDHVDFTLKTGEVHALVGENGAGKSTLIKILGGIYQCDSGEIFYNGRKINITKPADSIKQGINIIYQEFNLVPTANVAENIFLGIEPRIKNSFFIDKKIIHQEAKKILNYLGKEAINTHSLIKDLTVAQQQTVEIAKAIHREAKILIMDEPTAVLTEEETATLFSIIKTLKEKNIGMIYISHRLEEISKICDRVTVLRDGKKIITADLLDNTMQKDTLIKYMVGRELGDLYDTGIKRAATGETVLKVNNLCKRNQFSNINFSLNRGEILGFFGLIGSGRTEIMSSIFGLTKADSGSIELFGKKTAINSAHSAIRNGMGFVPEDRKRQGIIEKMSIRDNITLSILKNIFPFGFISEKVKSKVCNDYIEKLDITPKSQDRQLKYFSGGNQQKVVLSKWLATNPHILILDEPTRGIDIGAKKEIYKIINNLAENGISIIFISSEMEEVIGICDRMLVLHEGVITGELSRDEATQENILKMAAE
jgi:ribose transport system ATP-binding protein